MTAHSMDNAARKAGFLTHAWQDADAVRWMCAVLRTNVQRLTLNV